MRRLFQRPTHETLESVRKVVIATLVVLAFVTPPTIALFAVIDSRAARSTTDKGLLLLADAVADQVEKTCNEQERDRDRTRQFRIANPQLYPGQAIPDIPEPRDCDAEGDATEAAIQLILEK